MDKKETERVLLVYQTECSREERIEYLITQGCSIYEEKLQRLTVETDSHITEFYFKRYCPPFTDEFILRICGFRFNWVHFLQGDYPSDLVNFINTRSWFA